VTGSTTECFVCTLPFHLLPQTQCTSLPALPSSGFQSVHSAKTALFTKANHSHIGKSRTPPLLFFILFNFSAILKKQVTNLPFIGLNLFSIKWLEANFFFFFCRTGVWTHSFTFAKQVLYCLSHTSSPFYSVYFGDGGLTNYLPELALILDPSDLSLPSSKD
jgi:hypothetical protein